MPECFITWVFPACKVVHYPQKQYTETRFEDGTKVPASPIDTEHYRQTAARLGYGSNTARMSLEHELCHSYLAEKQGYLHSPTLWALAHNLKADSAEHFEEEQSVLAFQGYLHGRGLLQHPEWRAWGLEFLALVAF